MKHLPLKLKNQLPNKLLNNVFLSLFILLGALLLSSCAVNRPAGELSEITVLAQGQSIKKSPTMVAACKGFYITPEKLKAFFKHASLTHEEQASTNYAKLPCYSSGSAYLGNEEIQWVLRAGGVGEFHTQQDLSQDLSKEINNSKTKQSFTKICGVACCNKVQGVC